MKNFSGYCWLTVLALWGYFAMPSWAKDCPDIPQNITEITVKDNVATLRKEPKKDSEKGVSILEGDKLKVVDHVHKKDLSGIDSYCWYSVSKAPNSETYFIADAGIKEFKDFPLPEAQTQKGNNPQNQASSAQKPKVTPRSSSNQEVHQDSSPLSSLSENWPILLIIILVIGFGVIIIINRNNLQSLLSKFDSCNRRPRKDPLNKPIESIQSKLNRMEKALRFKIQQENFSYKDNSFTLQETLDNIGQKLNQVLEQFQSLSQSHQSHQQDFKLLEMRVEELEARPSWIAPWAISVYSSPESLPYADQSVKTTQEVTLSQEEINLVISPQLQDIINRFNLQRPELFNDFSATPLTLTSDSIQGKVGMNARRIVQLQIPADLSQAFYLEFDLDNSTWLIPNIKSPYISKIMRNLSENPEIFTISGSGSDSLELVRPAKLKEISAGLWEIEEPGEFSSGLPAENSKPALPNPKITPEALLLYNIQANINQCLEQLQKLTESDQSQQESLKLLEERLKNLENLSPDQDPHSSNEFLDFPIMLYIRKNGNTSFQELLDNIHCDEVNLKERLTSLQKENLIYIADNHDPQNLIYRLLT